MGYDPSEPRDGRGRWASAAGSAGRALLRGARAFANLHQGPGYSGTKAARARNRAERAAQAMRRNPRHAR